MMQGSGLFEGGLRLKRVFRWKVWRGQHSAVMNRVLLITGMSFPVTVGM